VTNATEMLQDTGRLMKLLGRGRRDRRLDRYAEQGIPTFDVRAGQAEAASYISRGGGDG
jgi:hypothetical protein